MILVKDKRCNAKPKTGFSCCTSSRKCKIGGGDCDNDGECEGDLVCGDNNCKPDYIISGSKWSTSADCCYGKKGK